MARAGIPVIVDREQGTIQVGCWVYGLAVLAAGAVRPAELAAPDPWAEASGAAGAAARNRCAGKGTK